MKPKFRKLEKEIEKLREQLEQKEKELKDTRSKCEHEYIGKCGYMFDTFVCKLCGDSYII